MDETAAGEIAQFPGSLASSFVVADIVCDLLFSGQKAGKLHTLTCSIVVSRIIAMRNNYMNLLRCIKIFTLPELSLVENKQISVFIYRRVI